MKIDTKNVNKTIFVENVKLTEIYNSSIELCSINNPDFLSAVTIGEEPIQIEVKKEIVYADEYTTPDGRHFRIGFSEQARNALGIPLEAWKNMQHENENLYNNIAFYRVEIEGYRKDIDKYRKFISYHINLSFWGRVKLVWQGFKLSKKMQRQIA